MFDVAYQKLLEDLTAHIDALEARLLTKLRLMQDPERVSYNLEEASKLTGIGYDKLYNACKAGRIEYFQECRGASIIIKRQTLIDYVSNNTSENSQTSQPHDSSDIRHHEGSFRATSKRKRLEGD